MKFIINWIYFLQNFRILGNWFFLFPGLIIQCYNRIRDQSKSQLYSFGHLPLIFFSWGLVIHIGKKIGNVFKKLIFWSSWNYNYFIPFQVLSTAKMPNKKRCEQKRRIEAEKTATKCMKLDEIWGKVNVKKMDEN